MNRRITGVVLVGVALVTLAGCMDPADPENLETRCEGADMIYILDDPSNGSDLVVIPDHELCRKLEDR